MNPTDSQEQFVRNLTNCQPTLYAINNSDQVAGCLRYSISSVTTRHAASIADLSKVLTNYDKSSMQWADGDFNGDGTVNISDLSVVLTNYDKTASLSAAGIAAVPEPAAGVLGMIAGLMAAIRAPGRRGDNHAKA
jgi:hypothetical protein